MKTKRNTKSKGRKKLLALLTLLFLLFCVGGAAVSVNLFYKSINASLTKMNEKPIATITFKHKTAQRKFEERMIWDRLRQNSPVYDGDTIRTAPESEATIYFVDGNVMDLGESTMAQIFFHDGMMAASLQGGAVTLDSTGSKNGAVISMGDSTVELLSGSSLMGAAYGEGGTQIDVMGGEVIYSNVDGVARKVGQGDSLLLDASNRELAVPLITVMQPRANQKFLNFDGKNYAVNFKWNSKNLSEGDFLVLEIASDKKFANVLQRKELRNISETSSSLPNGIFYWRIFPSKAGTGFSAQSKVNILDVPRPSLIVPEAHADFAYKARLPDIRFSWTQNEWVTAFDFEIADNPRFEGPVIKQRISTPSSIVSSLGEGVWYWRVAPYYTINGMGLAEPSAVRAFTVSKNGSIAKTQLIMPQQDDTVNTFYNNTIPFSWKKNPEGGEYEIVVAQDASFINTKIRKKQKTNFLNANAAEFGMKNGTWYWYVIQYDANGAFCDRSEPRRFFTDEIEFEQKMIYPPENYSMLAENAAALRFAWKTTVPGDTIFQIARDSNFRNVVFSQVSNEQYFQGANLSGGKYYWRIASQEKPEYATKGRPIRVFAPLAKPVLISPVQNSPLVVRENSQSVFSWQSVEGADFYNFTFFTRGANGTTIRTEQINQTSYSIPLENFPNGVYAWSVRAGTYAQEFLPPRFSETSQSDFMIRQVRGIVLNYPSNGMRIDGLSAKKNPEVAKWTAVENVVEATFTLSKNANGYTNAIYSVENSPNEIQLPRLEPGTYYWTVRGRTAEGIDVSARAISFVVGEVPLLAKAALSGMAAEPNKIFGAEEIRSSRSIVFEWDTVPEATSYSFVLRNARGEILINRNIAGTTYILQDMADLGNGKYTWSVQATQSMEDGTILRQGEIAANAFTIDAPEVEKIIINEAGTLYGF